MVTLYLMAIAALLPCLLCQNFPNDPLCKDMVCPANQICRHFKPCGERENCNVTAICTDTRPRRGGCLHGDPVLYNNSGRHEDLACYNAAPCSSNAYCSTELQDISSVCCLSNPVITVRPGVCPLFKPDPNRFWCVDKCRSDGDCHQDSKCCHTGCSHECIYIEPVTPPTPIDLFKSSPPPSLPIFDPCAQKVCPSGQKCRHFKSCGDGENCVVSAICTATQANRGGCKFGDPVLHNRNGTEKDLTCHPSAPCPSNSYCSTQLQDIAAVCCLSDPFGTLRDDLICPVPLYDPTRFWCVDECRVDGDCDETFKCCNTGCSMECVPAGTPTPPTQIFTAQPPPTPAQPGLQSLDPCEGMVCPQGQACRHYKPCGLKENCNVTGICTGVRVDSEGCVHGSPVLYTNNGNLNMLSCWREAPCPSNAYCSTVLADASSRCCLTDPAQRIKSGSCPAPNSYPYGDTNAIFCYDTCKHDGDCYWDEKCCNTGCKLECVQPQSPVIPAEPATPPPPPILTADPCHDKVCPLGQVCRHYKPCGLKQNCNVTSICTAERSGRNGCRHGSPVLFTNNGKLDMLSCWREAPCPSNAYCSTELMDTSSRCCLADPAQTVKSGSCPAPNSNPYGNTNPIFCYDQCRHDGDCGWDSKCCNTGCKLECVQPQSPVIPAEPITPPPLPTLTADPCHGRLCPQGQVCRHYKPCGLKENCNVTSICTAERSGRGGCFHGSPVLFTNNGKLSMLSCWREAPCPSNAYCSTLLQDTSSRCCLADPAKKVKSGSCPAPNSNPYGNTDSFSCYDQCRHDGDCGWDNKCCNTGCKLECVRPQSIVIPILPVTTPPFKPAADPCDYKLCPAHMYCRRRGQPCSHQWSCRPEGECNRCPFVPLIGMHSPNHLGSDPNGCPVVMPRRPPFAPGFGRPERRNKFTPMTWMLLSEYFNKK